jgi:hypothetical protein
MPTWRMSASRALFVVGVLLAALLLPAEAASAARTYTVKPQTKDVYVRNKASGYTIGTLRTGQAVDVQRTVKKGAWGYGLVHGEFGRWRGRHCGWLFLRGSFTKGGKVKNGCPRLHNVLPESKIFKHGSYLAHAGTGAVKPVNVVPCPDSRAFGNYDPRSRGFFTPYTSLTAGQGPERPGFGLRYVTKDGSAAMLKDSGLAGAPPWFFMSTACLERLPVYIGDDPRTEGDHSQGGFTVLFGDAVKEPSLLNTFKDAEVLGVRWRLWGSRNPVATGTARVNSCNPACANGKVARKRGVKIQLSNARVGDCLGHRAFLYTHATVTWPKIKGQPALGTTQHALSTHCAGYGRQNFCDELKLSFTTADVLSTRVRCSIAMSVARRVIKQRKRPGHGFKCKRHLNRKFALNTLKCTRGKARIDASWGD